ncbi:XdhC family protein [Neobacillus sp. SM06]|uniref:XdhC family protein n=1 Tax=Neobacillus sp. SM06 TaxID=3422492 RepID=UPI003D2DA7A3
MDDIHLILDGIVMSGKKVLATIIETEGSSYKKAGASMLFLENGDRLGVISGGCLEEDLAIRTDDVWVSGQAITVQYDLRSESDEGWGRGSGCNGIVTVLLEPVDDKLAADFAKVKKLLDDHIPVVLLKKIESEIEYLFVPFEGEPFGWWQGDVPFIEETAEKSGIIPGTSIFQCLVKPKPRLIVFGAGQDAQPLVSLAVKTGFKVVVCDWREALCTKKNFPDAHQLLLGFPRKLMRLLSFAHDDRVVIMTHDFQRDRELLDWILAENVSYIGVLGSKERTRRLLRQEEIPLPVYTPAGLSIGAVGAEEIAVSIVAQLIAECRSPSRNKLNVR